MSMTVQPGRRRGNTNFMTNSIEAISVIAVIIAGRVWSALEHKKTGQQVNEIRISINGLLDKRIEAAKEEGREEERQKQDKCQSQQ